jgi:benzodiazapine receptor
MRKVGKPYLRFSLLGFANTAWSWLLFGLHSPAAALAGIVFLWIAILLTILAFCVSLVSGWLMVPYLLWVSCASALNFTIWRLDG